jgi:hypothetical protein
MERVFTGSGWLVLPFWALMILAPRWRVTERLVRSPAVALAPALLYASLVLPRFAALLPHMARPELDAIVALLGTREGTTIAWAHFLAFDLFVGRWIYLDARERGLSAWLVSPLLALTLLFGPLGLLGHLALRSGAAGALASAGRRLFAQARRGSPALVAVALGSGALLVTSLVLQLLDARQVGGASTWLKPAKFGASVLVTAPVLAWILGQLGPERRGVRRAAGVFATTFAIELALITLQAARAVPSHFNIGKPFDFAVFQAMGVAITIFWITQVWLTVRAFRHRFSDAALGHGIRAGLLIATVGAGLAFTMTARVTPAQREAIAAGHRELAGAHAVGVEDGGRGLPGTRWSTEGGDLRVPHFVGLHALQLLPLVGWAASRRKRGFARAETGARLVTVAAVAYGGLVATTLVEALRGRPLLAPDGVTLALAGLVVGGAALAAAIVVALDGRRQPVLAST